MQLCHACVAGSLNFMQLACSQMAACIATMLKVLCPITHRILIKDTSGALHWCPHCALRIYSSVSEHTVHTWCYRRRAALAVPGCWHRSPQGWWSSMCSFAVLRLAHAVLPLQLACMQEIELAYSGMHFETTGADLGAVHTCSSAKWQPAVFRLGCEAPHHSCPACARCTYLCCGGTQSVGQSSAPNASFGLACTGCPP